jgi:hypothetical protein
MHASGQNLRAAAESTIRSVSIPSVAANSLFGESPCEHDGRCFCSNDQYQPYSWVSGEAERREKQEPFKNEWKMRSRMYLSPFGAPFSVECGHNLMRKWQPCGS